MSNWSSFFALPKANRRIHRVMHSVNIEKLLDEIIKTIVDNLPAVR